MNYRIINALALNSDFEFQSKEILISGGRIVAAFPHGEQAQTIDARGNIILPGFKNCHTHSAMTLLRGLAEDLPLKKWLFEKVFPFEAKMTEEDVYWGTRLAVLEYLRNGITAIGEMYFHYEGYISAARDSGFKAVGVAAVSDISGETGESLAIVESLYGKYSAFDGNVALRLGFHAEYTASDRLLDGLSQIVQRHRAPVFVHSSETREETDECIARHGVTPVERADKFGLFDYGGAVYHGVYLSDGDIEILKKRNVAVVTNPSSNLKLAAGVAPVANYLKRGLCLAIGTDGAASNNALDMFREMYLCAVLQKNLTRDAASMPAKTVLKAAVCTGAQVLGLPDTANLSLGSSADLIMLDLSAPNLCPHHDLIGGIVFAASPANVKMTMINGKILYRDGEYFVGESAENIIKNCERITARILRG